MSDLIDREDLVNGIYSDAPKDVLAYIAKFPSAEPEPEIIRCKDCVKQRVCRFSQYQGDDGFCMLAESGADMRGER